jgi:signal transduction histidine kinase
VRQRIVGLVFVVTALALLLLAIPLALDVRSRIRDDRRSELARIAAIAAADISVDSAAGRDQIELPIVPRATVRLAVYSAIGGRTVGNGPAALDASLKTLRAGRVAEADIGPDLVVAVPISVDEKLVSVVRASESLATIQATTRSSWLRILLVATIALAAATATAVALANRLLRPVRDLRTLADKIGTGVEVKSPRPSGISEIDSIIRALTVSADRVDRGMERERAFSSDVSHQLRTPITGLRLTLENELEHPASNRADPIVDALRDLDGLESTIEALLMLSRDTMQQRSSADCLPVVTERVKRWSHQLGAEGRNLMWSPPDGSMATKSSPRAIGEILDVLFDNARKYAHGAVCLNVEQRGDFVAFAVSDEGPGIANPTDVFLRRAPGATGTGIGLALARRLAEADGGQLVLVRHQPFCVFELLCVAAAPPR